MKKILVFILCLMLVCATPIVAFAEGGEVATEAVEGDYSTTVEESATEGEILPPETIPEETPTIEEEVEIEIEILTENIKKWLEENSALIGLIVTLIGYGIVTFKKLGTVIKSAGTLNNNAITIAKTSNDAVTQALTSIESASGAVTGYDVRIAALLEAFKTTAEDKATLEKELVEIKNYLKTSTQANVEFANELADLLALANIPNYKKEEIGARHLAAVNAIIEAEAKAEVATAEIKEVKKDDGAET